MGAQVYDFMGGESQYKASLSDREATLEILSIRRPKLKFMLLKTGRRMLDMFTGVRS